MRTGRRRLSAEFPKRPGQIRANRQRMSRFHLLDAHIHDLALGITDKHGARLQAVVVGDGMGDPAPTSDKQRVLVSATSKRGLT